MLKHSEAREFLKTTKVEISTLISKKTWKKSSYNEVKATNKTPIFTTWIFKYKFDNEEYLIKHKTRLCARNDLQQIDQNVYATTLIIKIFRIVMTIIIAFNLKTRQYDAVNVFANSEIDEPTYIKSPEEWKGHPVFLLLLRTLYGLKQSSTLWYRNLFITLNELGLEQISGIECLFICDYMILFFFVNDIVVIYDRQYFKQIDEFETKLFKVYEMRNMNELEWFLDIRITRNRELDTMTLCQDNYIDKLIVKFNININKKVSNSSLEYITMIKNIEQITPQSIYAYQQRVKSINFAAITTRPNVTFAASKLTEFLTNFSDYHINQSDHTLEYLVHTKKYAIVFNDQSANSEIIFLTSSDVSFANDEKTRQNAHEYCFRLFNELIDWKTSKQRTITTSSTEAKLLIMFMIANSKMWWNRFFECIRMNIECKTHIECDNQQTIRALIAPTFKLHIKLRHVNIHRHWLRQKIQKETITVQWTPTTKILIDDLTKALSSQRHKKFVRMIELKTIELGTSISKSKKNLDSKHQD